MTQQALVSVVMPVYNAESFLQEAIESILNQTYTNFEFIILNDGSSDNSLKIIESFADKRIKLLSSLENKGLVWQLNTGFKVSKGKYIARMDSDDVALPTRLFKQVEFLEKRKEVGVLGSFVKPLLANSNNAPIWKMPTQNDAIKTHLLEGAVFCHPSVMLRAAVIKSAAVYYNPDYKHCEDYKFWVDLIPFSKFANLAEPLVLYRLHEGQVSHTWQEIQQHQMQRIIATQLKALQVSENSVDILQNLFIGRFKHMQFAETYRAINELVILNKENQVYKPKYLKRLLANRLSFLLRSTREKQDVPTWKIIFGSFFFLLLAKYPYNIKNPFLLFKKIKYAK